MIRPLRQDDAMAMHLCWQANNTIDPISSALLYEKVWGDADVDEALLLGYWSEDILQAFVTGVVRDTVHGRIGYTKLLVVDHKVKRQGIGRLLMTDLERRMYERGAEKGRIGESAPNYLIPGVDVRYTHAWLLFQSMGYQKFGETYNLTVDLASEDWSTDADEERLETVGVTVRRALGSDADTVMAFLDVEWPAWKAEVGQSLTRDPVALHLAYRGDELLGFSAFDTNNVGLGWFGPMGTTPAARGLGIGRVLLRCCLRDQRAQGHAQSIIPWVGPIGFYAHHAGALIARVFYRLEKPFT